MKTLFATMLIFLLGYGFQQTAKEHVDFNDYQYPSNKLESERQFIYQKVNSKEPEFNIQYKKIIHLNGQKTLAHYDKGASPYDSAITEADNHFKLIEIIRFDYDSLNTCVGQTKGEILKNRISKGKMETTVKYEKNNIISKTNKKMELVKDTTFVWKNQIIEAIYFENEYDVDVKHKYLPFLGQDRSYLGYSIYAKSLGLVQYGTSVNGELIEWVLTEIN